MPSQLLRRRFDAPVFQANSTQSSKIPRGDLIRKLTFTLSQTPTIAGGSNTPALAQPGDGLAAISKLQIQANGADTLIDIPGQAIRMLNYFLYRNLPNKSLTLGQTGSANPALVDTFEIPFECFINAKSMDTALWTQPLTALDLRVTWAPSWTAVNSAASAYTVNPSLECNYLPASLGFKIGANGGSAVPQYPPVGMRVRTYTQQFAGSGTGQRIDLDAGRFSYRGLIIQAKTVATPAVDTAGLFSRVQCLNGVTTLWDMSEPTLQNESKDLIERGILATTAGLPYLPSPGVSSSSSYLGWYFMDFCPDGRLSEAPATNGNDRFSLFFDTTAQCEIDVYAIQLLNLANGNPSP